MWSTSTCHRVNPLYWTDSQAVCSDKAWRALAVVNVDSNNPNLRQDSHPTIKWRGSTSSWNPHLRYRLPIAQCQKLWQSVELCVCKDAQMTIVSDHLDNAGFSVTSRRFLLKSMYIIRRKHLSKWTSWLQSCLFHHEINSPYIYILVIVFTWLYSL